MEQKPFVWTTYLAKKLFKLRFENEWLFKKKKQPWSDFYKLLLDNDFPREMSINHVRKKWSYTYDSYRVAKKTNNKHWIYFKIFDKHYGKKHVLDKYESWNDEWRLKLITCIETAKAENLNYNDLWRTVERAMRCQELPNDCCIQDIKGLWQYIKNTFSRKYRLALKKGAELTEWPLYDILVNYFKSYEPEFLLKMDSDTFECKEKKCSKYFQKDEKQDNGNRFEFQWSKDITETFIQIRLQNEWLFRKKKWAWNDLAAIMAEEHGFPKHLNGRELCKKWASTYGEYQKAKATNNKSWVYYNLFELYIGDGNFSLNPLIGWHEEWVSKLIVIRTSLEYMFRNKKDQSDAWREVEKELRRLGLPLDHSLLDLTEIWSYLIKAFRWKKKFANKGILNEQWPYYNLMSKYDEVPISNAEYIPQTEEHYVEDNYLDDDDDEIKLFDLKQRLQLKPKFEVTDSNQCRACAGYEACVNIFEKTADNQNLDIAAKMNLVGGVEVEKSDQLPVQICLTCLNDLENAFEFRRRCQDADKQFRNNIVSQRIKVESNTDDGAQHVTVMEAEPDKTALDDFDTRYDLDFQTNYQTKISVEPIKIEKQKFSVKNNVADSRQRKKVYHYWKVCEVCGKNTRNLQSHLDTHAIGKMYSCDICNKKFKFKSGLVVHKAVHNPTPKKNCEVCGKSFYILSQYRKHFMYHANERKFGCEQCGKRFNTLDILRVHKRMHTDERPFSCKECGKSFRTAGCVSRHKRIVHKDPVKIK